MEFEGLSERVSGVHATTVRDWWVSARAPGPIAVLQPMASQQPGAHVVDAAIDAGSGALLLADEASPAPTVRAVAALLTGSDAASVVAPGFTDTDTMLAIAQVRDLMARLRGTSAEVERLLAEDARLAWQASCIARAATRRTPVLLAGANPQIAALCVQRLAPAAVTWLRVGVGDADPASQVVRARLDLVPILDSTFALTREGMVGILQVLAQELDAKV